MTIWLHCPVAKPDAGLRLVCFPHAGGSAAFFRDWGNHLPGIEVHAVRYPGRAERIAEPPPTDLRELAGQIARAVAPLADRPLALFGHSLGAVVALETARSLAARGISLVHLFASGSRNGPAPSAEELSHDEDPDAVAERLISLGGTDAELAADPYFRELVLPYVLADGRIYHTYAHRTEPVLDCPVTTIAGDRDADADRRPWPELTTGAWQERTVPGEHFYLIADPPYGLVTDCSGSLRHANS